MLLIEVWARMLSVFCISGLILRGKILSYTLCGVPLGEKIACPEFPCGVPVPGEPIRVSPGLVGDVSAFSSTSAAQEKFSCVTFAWESPLFGSIENCSKM